jgi:hypothetical protein
MKISLIEVTTTQIIRRISFSPLAFTATSNARYGGVNVFLSYTDISGYLQHILFIPKCVFVCFILHLNFLHYPSLLTYVISSLKNLSPYFCLLVIILSTFSVWMFSISVFSILHFFAKTPVGFLVSIQSLSILVSI